MPTGLERGMPAALGRNEVYCSTDPERVVPETLSPLNPFPFDLHVDGSDGFRRWIWGMSTPLILEGCQTCRWPDQARPGPGPGPGSDLMKILRLFASEFSRADSGKSSAVGPAPHCARAQRLAALARRGGKGGRAPPGRERNPKEWNAVRKRGKKI